MNEKKPCACGEAPKLIFSCSGAADVGHLSDLAARKLTSEGYGKMFCLSGIGGNVSGIIKTTESASKILVIDGCGIDCAKKTLEEKGFKDFEFIRITDLGFEKGKTKVNDESVSKTVSIGIEKLKC